MKTIDDTLSELRDIAAKRPGDPLTVSELGTIAAAEAWIRAKRTAPRDPEQLPFTPDRIHTTTLSQG